MAFQVYLVVCRDGRSVEGVKEVVAYLRELGALVLLATKQHAVVAGFDDSRLEFVRRHHGVSFVGGVTLDPRGLAAGELQVAFREHLTRQLAAPGNTQGQRGLGAL
jgi:hypothetical protein